jgi:Leucine-rich repeat (LRR) protein
MAANNNFVGFPIVLASLSNLEALDLSNNKLEELPGEIGMMRGLQSLNVMNNQLTDVPVELGTLTKLTQFDYAGNPFSAQIQNKIMTLMTTGTYTEPKVIKSSKKKSSSTRYRRRGR